MGQCNPRFRYLHLSTKIYMKMHLFTKLFQSGHAISCVRISIVQKLGQVKKRLPKGGCPYYGPEKYINQRGCIKLTWARRIFRQKCPSVRSGIHKKKRFFSIFTSDWSEILVCFTHILSNMTHIFLDNFPTFSRFLLSNVYILTTSR